MANSEVAYWRLTRDSDASLSSSTSFQDDSQLWMESLPGDGANIRIEGGLTIDCGLLGGFKLEFDGTAGQDDFFVEVIAHNQATGILAGSARIEDYNVTASFTGATKYAITLRGYMHNTSVGDLHLRWAQTISSGSATIVRRGSFLSGIQVV